MFLVVEGALADLPQVGGHESLQAMAGLVVVGAVGQEQAQVLEQLGQVGAHLGAALVFALHHTLLDVLQADDVG